MKVTGDQKDRDLLGDRQDFKRDKVTKSGIKQKEGDQTPLPTMSQMSNQDSKKKTDIPQYQMMLPNFR